MALPPRCSDLRFLIVPPAPSPAVSRVNGTPPARAPTARINTRVRSGYLLDTETKMKMKLSAASLAILMGLLFAAIARAEDTPKPIDVWPSKAPGDSIKVEEKWDKKRATNVSHPTLEFFRPEKDKDTGVAVIVCPGGGYKNLMMDYEGEDAARWLNTIGVTGIVLKYRVPGSRRHAALVPASGCAAVDQLCPRKAKELAIDPNKIGILGFSAGDISAVRLQPILTSVHMRRLTRRTK